MYDKIKTVLIEGDEVTIYKNYQGEYIAEYSDTSGRTNTINCGPDYFDIATKIQEVLGDIDVEQEELLELSNMVELQLDGDTTIQTIEMIATSTLMDGESLYSRDILDEVIKIVESRFGRVQHDSNVRIKLEPMASMDKWLHDAITSQRIYRLDTENEYDEQAVRIIGAYTMSNGDYMIAFAILEVAENDEGEDVWATERTFMKPLSQCTLVHDLSDEVSPRYQD